MTSWSHQQATRRIIVGVDDSESAARAASTAASLAGALGAELHVVTAYGKFEIERHRAGSEEYIFTSEADAEGVAASVVEQLRRDFPAVKFHLHPAEGKPADALVRTAESLDADLIVVGNKRAQGLARILGSIAHDVAAHAPCDVYVAHTHQR